MIRHIVTWRIDTGDRDEKAARVATIAAALAPMVDLVDGLDWLDVHADVHETDGNWDVVLVSQFQSRAALEAYQVHPQHVAAGGVIRSVVSERASIDYELA